MINDVFYNYCLPWEKTIFIETSNEFKKCIECNRTVRLDTFIKVIHFIEQFTLTIAKRTDIKDKYLKKLALSHFDDNFVSSGKFINHYISRCTDSDDPISFLDKDLKMNLEQMIRNWKSFVYNEPDIHDVNILLGSIKSLLTCHSFEIDDNFKRLIVVKDWITKVTLRIIHIILNEYICIIHSDFASFQSYYKQLKLNSKGCKKTPNRWYIKDIEKISSNIVLENRLKDRCVAPLCKIKPGFVIPNVRKS